MEKLTVAKYLIKRLADLGITDVFGVPGDYNFRVVDAVETNKDVKWVGCCNELNAGYAADGYARIRGIGAVVTTFGVGELSAVNAIAGSFSESLPVIMIVGSPKSSLQKNHAIIHHTLGNGDFDFAHKIYKNITVATTLLTPENAVSEIERVLSAAVNKKKPVYISMPVDVCDQSISGEIVPFVLETSDQGALNSAVETIAKILNQSKNPVIIADAGVYRNQIKNEVEQLVKKSGYPATTMFMGKSS
jgi:indolepyruvate decarboxylase